MNIAIIRLSSLGDVIFCMACLQLIRKRFPESCITWIADAKFADILDYNPDIDQVVKLDLKRVKKNLSLGGIAAEWGKLSRVGKVDMAIDLHGMIKSAVIAKRVGRTTSGFGFDVVKEPLGALLYGNRFSPPREQAAVFRYAHVVANSLGFDFKENDLVKKKPFLYYEEADLVASEPFFRSDRKNIMFIPETSIDYKNYPKEKFAQIGNRLGENILLCHGNDRELATAKFVAERCACARILPRLNLNQLKAAVSRADLVIGGDTGPTHMAWANNIPSITLFGATPVCTSPSPVNVTLKSESNPNFRKPDRNDFSIREIEETTIIRHAEELLNKRGGTP